MKRIALAAVLVALPAAAAAQQGAGNPGIEAPGEIIVRGTRPLKERISDYVATLTPSHGLDTLGRFHEPVCPVAIGLTPAQNEKVAKRLRRIAEAIGIGAARTPCRPNVTVVATRDKARLIADIARRKSEHLANVGRNKIEAMVNDDSAAAAWQVIGFVDDNGVPLMADENGTVTAQTTAGGRLRATVMKTFVASIVLVEYRALKGVTTRQLADYAAMRAFAPIDPLSPRNGRAGAALPAESILSLFNAGTVPAAAPTTMTWWDLAFLTALYGSDEAYFAISKRRDMSTRMAKILADLPDEE